LKVSQPASIRVLDDSFVSTPEAHDLFVPLRQQTEAIGWRTDLVTLEDLLQFFQTTSQPTRDQVVLVTTNKLSEETNAALLDFIARGGAVVMMTGIVPFPKKLDISWTANQDEELLLKSVNRLGQSESIFGQAPCKQFLTNTTAPAEARYVPLISAHHQTKPLGEIAALFDYHGAKKGALIVVTPSLTLRPTPRNITPHEQATAILKTALVYLLEGGEHFFIYEFRDQVLNTKAKCYGIVEEDFGQKDAATALNWLRQQIGPGGVVRHKTYFTAGALLELENLQGERYAITWGQEALAKFKAGMTNGANYTPETYQRIAAKKLLHGLEQQQASVASEVIVWRAVN